MLTVFYDLLFFLKQVFYCLSHVFSMQASSSIWKILKARFESDLLVKSQGEETGLIKKSKKIPEKVINQQQ